MHTKKYFFIGCLVAFLVIFNAGYVFHELLMGGFFKKHIGGIQREHYQVPVIALAFLLYTIFQAYFLPVFYAYTKLNYQWSLLKTAVVFGAVTGFLWDGLQGGMIEVATFKMPWIVFWIDSGYHVLEGIVTALILSVFYKKQDAN